jgi:hypothetical protein
MRPVWVAPAHRAGAAGAAHRAARAAGRLGLFWGLGHALTLFAFGLPILLLEQYLPERVQQAAETLVAAVIIYLGVRLLARWRSGAFHVHAHEHEREAHTHMHSHEQPAGHTHPKSRSPLGAFSIGLVHGMGGSAGVGVLIVASVESTGLAVLSLALLAAFTAVSMCIVSTGFGATLVSRPLRASYNGVAPALATASLAFGFWYGTAAWGLMPYPF